MRRNVLGILGSHSFFDKVFQSRDTHAELVLQQFADRTNAAVAKVVDVVDRADSILQIEVGGNGCNDIVNRNVLMAKLIHQRTDNLSFLVRRNGIFAA